MHQVLNERSNPERNDAEHQRDCSYDFGVRIGNLVPVYVEHAGNAGVVLFSTASKISVAARHLPVECSGVQ